MFFLQDFDFLDPHPLGGRVLEIQTRPSVSASVRLKHTFLTIGLLDFVDILHEVKGP